MSFIRRFFIGIAEWLAFLFVLFGTLVGAAAGRENGDYLGGKFGIPSGLRDAFGMAGRARRWGSRSRPCWPRCC